MKGDKELLYKKSYVLDFSEIVVMINMSLVLFVLHSGL